MDLERLTVRLMADATQFNRAMDGAENRLARFSRGFGLLGRSLDIPILAATGTVLALGTAIGFAAVETVKLGAEFERAAISLEVMTGSASVAKTMMTEIQKMGVETPFKSPDLLRAAQILKSYNIENRDLVDTLKVLGDVAQGDTDRLNRIARAFGQVKAAGRLMGQEMLQFVNAGAISLEDLAKVLDVHPSRVKVMIEEAKVSFNDVVKAFNNITGEGGRFFKINERINQTVAGQWSALIETIQLGMIRVSQSFFKAFDVQQTLSYWVAKLKSSEGQFDAFFTKLRRWFDDLVKGTRAAIYWIEKAYESVRAWYKDNEKLIDGMVKGAVVVLGLAAAVYVLTTAIWALYSPLGLALVALTAFVAIGGTAVFDDFGEGLKEAFEEVEGDFKKLSGMLSTAFKEEDWQAVGEIIGTGMRIGILTAYHGLMADLKSLLIGGTMWVVRKQMEALKIIVQGFAEVQEALFPGSGIGDALGVSIDLQIARLNALEASAKKGVLAEQNKDLQKDLAPHRERIAKIEQDAKVRREQKAFEEWAKTHPGEAARLQMEQAASIEYIQRIAEQAKIAQRWWGDPSQWDDKQKAEWMRNADAIRRGIDAHADAAAIAMEGMFGGAEAAAKEMEKRGEAAVGGAARIRQLPQYAGTTLAYVNRLQHEMDRGQWAGETTDKFGLFIKHMDAIHEAFTGPKDMGDSDKLIGEAAMDMVAGRPMEGMIKLLEVSKATRPLIGESERDFAILQEYNNLKNAIGREEYKPPPTALRGSTEAQDAINRAMQPRATVQEQVRDLLQRAVEVQEQQRDYQKQVVEELKRWNAERMDFGGGGDF